MNAVVLDFLKLYNSQWGIDSMRFLGMGMALSLVSNAIVAIAPLRALPDNQIIDKLQGIPVFTLTDQSGAPLTASVNGTDGKKNTYTGGYISRKDAQSFLQTLQKKDPNLAKQLQIRAVRLSELYNVQFNSTPDKKLDIAYVGNQQQVNSALAILQKTNRNLKSVGGVPLFIGRAGKPAGYITVDQNGKKVIPIFFDREQLQPYIDKFKKERPDLAATAEIQVITLEGLITSLRTKNADARADALYNQVLLYPSREAIEYLSSQRSGGTTQPQAQPTTVPSTPSAGAPSPNPSTPAKPPKKKKRV
jgi:Tic22-like family